MLIGTQQTWYFKTNKPSSGSWTHCSLLKPHDFAWRLLNFFFSALLQSLPVVAGDQYKWSKPPDCCLETHLWCQRCDFNPHGVSVVESPQHFSSWLKGIENDVAVFIFSRFFFLIIISWGLVSCGQLVPFPVDRVFYQPERNSGRVSITPRIAQNLIFKKKTKKLMETRLMITKGEWFF